MITQDTIYIGSTLIRQYAAHGRYAHVNVYGQVFGYPNADALDMGVSDFSSWEQRSTHVGNELAIAYVLKVGK